METNVMSLELFNFVLHMRANGVRVPPNIYYMLESIGIHLNQREWLLRPERPKCGAICRNGNPCTNAKCFGMETCAMHIPNRQREPPVFKQVCPKLTASGEPCKCGVYKDYDMCWSHAKKEGVLPPASERPTECPICYEKMLAKDRVRTKCNHYFHRECMNNWVKQRVPGNPARPCVDCPMCRQKTTIHSR